MTMAGMSARSATEALGGAREHSTSSTGTDTLARGAETTWMARGCISTGTETGDQSHSENLQSEFYFQRFEGVFDKGQFSGEGLFFFGSLDKYSGEFNRGKLEGRGKMTYRDGHIYVGQFRDWRQAGEGKMTFRNGDIVEGNWDGEMGKGTITYTDGSMYEVKN